MEYIDFKRLIDALTAKPKETEWLEFKHNCHFHKISMVS